MSTVWSHERVEKAAHKLAKMLKDCPMEERGNIFLKAAKELRLNSQNYTASLLHEIGTKYNGHQ